MALLFLLFLLVESILLISIASVILAVIWLGVPRRERIVGTGLTCLIGLGCGAVVAWYLYQPIGEKVGPLPAIFYGSAAMIASMVFTGLLLFGIATWRERGPGRLSSSPRCDIR